MLEIELGYMRHIHKNRPKRGKDDLIINGEKCRVNSFIKKKPGKFFGAF
jgi:hypothetical protein